MKVIFFTFFAICCAQVKSFEILSEVLENYPNKCSTDIKRGPFVQIGQKYYLIETTKKLNWFTAAHVCRSMNANLATIETAAEMDAIAKHLIAHGYGFCFWTSGNDLTIEGNYEWLSTGKPMLYKKWAPSQPNNLNGKENCVQLWTDGRDYYMNDLECHHDCQYICEANQPKTIALTIL